MDMSQAILATEERQYFVDVIVLNATGERKIIFKKLDSKEQDLKKIVLESAQKYNVPKVDLVLYRPNGSSYKLVKEVTVDVDPNETAALGSLTNVPAPIVHQPTVLKGGGVTDFTAYVIKDQEKKIDKLESELKEVKKENKDNEKKIVELEKTIIQKNHEISDLQSSVEAKGGLSGFMDTASQSPIMIEVLGKVIDKLMTPAPAPSGMVGIPQADAETMQYLNNLNNWYVQQEPEVKGKLFAVFQAVAMAPNKLNFLNSLINLIQNDPEFRKQA